ncbi:SDR family oxidoreductase [Nonomuraea fuscirosea]|uniref:SDR family oxidoreductase n=1 Tax=Nonomuraea fuscirosea TaxID=1291556 RepID=UPI002DD8E269|nr:SDR family oxidoreductase [Nonomuraea fuscirosea]WSA49446.1 SDR family oxidoreductase [Nonomuraea fuscirosea]
MTVTYDYAGKHVLVTGGTKGIGAGIAAAFAAAGAEVTVCARTPPSPHDRGSGGTGAGAGGSGFVPAGGIRLVQADVRDPADVERLISGFDRLDVVVNNAGGSPPAPLEGTSPRLHARVIELNLTAPLLVSQRAYPLLAAVGGAVVMIGSASGARPSPGTSAYGAAKAGLHHLARCLAAEWAPRVRVNTVVVGLASTQDAADHYGGRTDLDGRAIPAGRMATPADVAQVCLWLAAPGYVTGAEVRVDGGGEIPAWRHLVSD